MNYYEILGVPRTADGPTIKRAYRKIAIESHPDRVGNDPKKTERFRQATEAYAVLSDESKRAEYDSLESKGEDSSGLASTLFGPLFDNLVTRVRTEGITARNFDSLMESFFGVAKDVQKRVPERVAQGTKSPGNFLDLLEEVLDKKIEIGKRK